MFARAFKKTSTSTASPRGPEPRVVAASSSIPAASTGSSNPPKVTSTPTSTNPPDSSVFIGPLPPRSIHLALENITDALKLLRNTLDPPSNRQAWARLPPDFVVPVSSEGSIASTSPPHPEASTRPSKEKKASKGRSRSGSGHAKGPSSSKLHTIVEAEGDDGALAAELKETLEVVEEAEPNQSPTDLKGKGKAKAVDFPTGVPSTSSAQSASHSHIVKREDGPSTSTAGRESTSSAVAPSIDDALKLGREWKYTTSRAKRHSISGLISNHRRKASPRQRRNQRRRGIHPISRPRARLPQRPRSRLRTATRRNAVSTLDSRITFPKLSEASRATKPAQPPLEERVPEPQPVSIRAAAASTPPTPASSIRTYDSPVPISHDRRDCPLHILCPPAHIPGCIKRIESLAEKMSGWSGDGGKGRMIRRRLRIEEEIDAVLVNEVSA